MEQITFGKWLKNQRYTILLTIFCALLPVIVDLWLDLKKDRYEGHNIFLNHFHVLSNALFVAYCMFSLINSRFLQDLEGSDKPQRLFNYVKNKFGTSSALYNEGETDLYERMVKSLSQFYYSWLVVWGLWLVFYLGKFVYALIEVIYATEDKHIFDQLSRYENLFENTFNILNSFVIFFIYMVITISTVKQSTPGHNLKQMNRYILVLAIIGLICFMFDLGSLAMNNDYYAWQLFLKLSISFIACISLMALLGRLNSSFLEIPQWLILSLYIYAALQMLYPLSAFKSYLHEIFTPCLKDYKDIDQLINTNFAMTAIYYIAFIGKICLFLMIKWVLENKRFLFYLIHNAQVLAESDDMLKEFKRYCQKHR